MTLRSWRFALVVAIPLVALGMLAAQQTLTQRFPQFENDDVKVWKSVIAPNAPLAPHRHEHGRVLIPLRGGPIDIVQDRRFNRTFCMGDWQSLSGFRQVHLTPCTQTSIKDRALSK